MESTGFSEVIGSWKIIAISRPRTRRISSSESVRRSRPLKVTFPPTIWPAGCETSRMIESALTLLPQPDSPTSATVSPSFTSHETSSAARLERANRHQLELRATDLDGLLPPEHRARIVWDFVEGLDLGPLYRAIRAVEGGAGRPAIDPAILTALWLYATLDGVGSARAL